VWRGVPGDEFPRYLDERFNSATAQQSGTHARPVLLKMIPGVLAVALLMSGCGNSDSGNQANATDSSQAGATFDVIKTAACGGRTTHPWPAGDAGLIKGARCKVSGSFTFVKMCESPQALQLWMSRAKCYGGYAVASDDWVAYQVYYQQDVLQLMDLGGTQVC
jgi:hypothetical protein